MVVNWRNVAAVTDETTNRQQLIDAVLARIRERDKVREDADAAVRVAIQDATDGGVRLRELAVATSLSTARIAQLRDGTITDEIQIAIAEHIARAKDDPELASKAAKARAEIEREAVARQQAIATLFADGGEPSSTRPRRTAKGGETSSEN